MRRLSYYVSVLALLSCVCGTAYAAEEAGAHGETPNLFGGNVGNAIWTLLIFGLLLLVLGKYAWGPLLGALQKREEFIRDSLKQAKHDREEADRQLKEYSEQLRQSREEASKIVEEGRRDAEVLRKKIEADARSEAEAMIQRARREISTATDTAVKEIYSMTADLSTQIASRIIGKEVDESAHKRLIDESIEELAKYGDNSRN